MRTKDTTAGHHPGHWEEVFDGRPPACVLWRDYCDWVNRQIISRFPVDPAAPGDPLKVLKTDLFEETQGTGLAGPPGSLFSPATGVPATLMVGIDIAESAIRMIARTREDVVPVRASVIAPPFRQQAFDAVISTSTLDHFTDEARIRRSLEGIHAVLRPGGMLFLTMDNPANPLIRARRGRILQFLRRTRILPYYVGATLPCAKLKAMLEDIGFSILWDDHVMHFPRIVGVHLVGLLHRLHLRAAGRLSIRMMKLLEHLPCRWVRSVTGHYSAIVAQRHG